MKKFLLLVLALACISFMGCTANENDNSIQNDEQETNEVKLENTYTTQFGEINSAELPSFCFDYPSNWNITNETVSPQSENVELSTENGVTIYYEYIAPDYAYGNMAIASEVENTKVSDSKFVADKVLDTDYPDSGSFMVAKTKILSMQDLRNEPEPERYTDTSEPDYFVVKPESESGKETIDGNFITAFWYGGLIQFYVPITEKITPEEEQEIVAILSSFRIAEE